MKRIRRLCYSLILTMIVALVTCCGKKESKKKAPAPTVNCEKMCTQTFKKCVGEVLVASGKMDQKKIDLIKKAGAFQKVQEAGYEACMKDCKKKQGFGSDADKINKCLEKKDCKSYADCIKKQIK